MSEKESVIDLDLEQKAATEVVVNPNPAFTYRDTIGGVEYVFYPMKKYRLPEEQALFLVSRARDAWNSQRISAEAELDMFLRLSEDTRPSIKSKSIWFGVRKGDRVITKSNPPPRPGLVLLSTEEGLRFYHDSLQEVLVAAEDSSVVDTLQGTAQVVEELPMYDLAWSSEKKVAYIRDVGKNSQRLYTHWKTNTAGLDKQLADIFESRKRILDRDGAKYKVTGPETFTFTEAVEGSQDGDIH